MVTIHRPPSVFHEEDGLPFSPVTLVLNRTLTYRGVST